MPQCFTPSQLHVSHRCCLCWICYCYLWFSAEAWAQSPGHRSFLPLSWDSEFLFLYARIFRERFTSFFILHRWQLRDILVLSYHSSWQGHVCGTRSVNLSLNLAALPCVSPRLTRKGKVLETCEDALVGVWFLEQCWSDVIRTMVLLKALTFCTGSFNKGRKSTKSEVAIYLIWWLKQTWNYKVFSKGSLSL